MKASFGFRSVENASSVKVGEIKIGTSRHIHRSLSNELLWVTPKLRMIGNVCSPLKFGSSSLLIFVTLNNTIGPPTPKFAPISTNIGF